jgi:hypothetical protein
MKAVRLMLWLSGTLGITFAGLQIVGLALFFTVGRVACKPVIVGDGKAKHSMQLDIELHEPDNHWDELIGAHLPELRPGELHGCLAKWTDEDPIMMLDSDGPKNGTELVFWKAITLRGRTTLGRYVADLWTGVSIGSGGALGSRAAWAKVGNIRLIERMLPPQPAPPGFRAILPGEYVSGSLKEDKDRVVGRYWIKLPAPSSVSVYTDIPNETDVELRERLTFEDLDVPEEIDTGSGRPTGRLIVSHAGFHKVTTYRVDPPGAAQADGTSQKNYALQVYWGKYLQ